MVTIQQTTQYTIDRVEAAAYRIPTDRKESDGTYEWDSTTLIVVHAWSGQTWGLGYTYGHEAIIDLIHGKLAGRVRGRDPVDGPALWAEMMHAVRNNGQTGLDMMAIAAVDCAIWDLRARLLGVPLATLLGTARREVPVYGSGGFTSYSLAELADQLGGYASAGMHFVKMKIGRGEDFEPRRMETARKAIGRKVGLFVDANGAYQRKQALAVAEALEAYNVVWFEEPVWHADLEGLRLIRDRGPAGMDISAGEYGFSLAYFHDMLKAGAVDVLQADASRCGITTFLQVAALCQAHNLPLSSHTAPSLHLHPCCACQPVRHMEYFHDHVRIEHMLFDGARDPQDGQLRPDFSRPGLGLEFKRQDARRYHVASAVCSY